jgi:nucleoid-associated protein Lsr2
MALRMGLLFASSARAVIEGKQFVARREIVVLEDDLDGGNADESVKFALDGIAYEIDLNSKNAGKLRDAFAPYVKVARKARGGVVTGGRSAATRATRGSAATDREQNKAIREWAKRQGREISARGRIPQGIVDEYMASAGR